MTLQQLITSVTNNLGDRASGTIGSETVASVVLQGVNQALPQVVKLANPEYYDRTVKQSIVSGGPTEMPLPPVNFNGHDHVIKDLVHLRTSRAADGTPVTLVRKPWYEFMKVTSDYDQQHTGIPSFVAFREGSIFINRVPEEDYNMTLFVEVWPRNLTTSDLEIALPINVFWELAIEAYATYYCYLKLQQAPLAQYWKVLYEEQKTVNSQQTRKTDIRGSGDNGGVIVSAQPWLQPFVDSYNS